MRILGPMQNFVKSLPERRILAYEEGYGNSSSIAPRDLSVHAWSSCDGALGHTVEAEGSALGTQQKAGNKSVP